MSWTVLREKDLLGLRTAGMKADGPRGATCGLGARQTWPSYFTSPKAGFTSGTEEQSLGGCRPNAHGWHLRTQ